MMKYLRVYLFIENHKMGESNNKNIHISIINFFDVIYHLFQYKNMPWWEFIKIFLYFVVCITPREL